MQIEWTEIDEVEDTEELLAENADMAYCLSRKH